MCIAKKIIPNLAYDPHNPLTSKFIEVNCNRCWQCRMERSNGFAFRMLHEVLKPDVVPFFITLTYSDKYLPLLFWHDKANNIHSVSCWNRDHVQRYLKNVRRQLHYYYGISSSSFKYLCACERGTDRVYVDYRGVTRVATERTHFHLLPVLVVPACPTPLRPLPDDFFSYCRSHHFAPDFTTFFRYLLVTKWHYGNVDDIAFCRDIVACVLYITKYINKQHDDPIFRIPLDNYETVFDRDYFERLSSSLHQPLNFSSYDLLIDGSDFPRCFDYPALFRKNPPRCIQHFQIQPRAFGSINLGFDFVRNLSLDELTQYFTGSRNVTLPGVHKSTSIPLPSYYFNKLCRSVDKLHLNRVYTKRVFDGSAVRIAANPTTPTCVRSKSWNNVDGLGNSSSDRVYTASSVSTFGVQMKRHRVLQSIKDQVRKVRLLYSFSELHKSLFEKFLTFPPDLQHNYYIQPETVDTVLNSRLPINKLFSMIAKFRYRDFGPDYPLSETETLLSNTLKFVRLCQFTKNHLKHLAFESIYAKKLPSVARDNPDLFLNHYL